MHGRGVAEGIIADFVKDLVRRNRIIPKLDPNIHRPRILWKNHSLLSRLGTLLITKSSRCSRRPTDERGASLRSLFVPFKFSLLLTAEHGGKETYLENDRSFQKFKIVLTFC